MTPQARIFFAVAAVAALSAVGWLSFREVPSAEFAPVVASVEQPAPAAPAAAPAPAPQAKAEPVKAPSTAIPYRDLTRVAAERRETIYTTSSMGEPMEVHPDGTVVIHNHRKVFTYADGRQEVRFARITAKPSWIPMSGLQVPKEDMR